MPTHWTYASFENADDLYQGDILKPSDALRSLFSEVHRHFVHDKYLGFLVATQSCDLVRRTGTPKAPYISLTVIRPLGTIAHKLIGHVARPVTTGTFRASDKRRAKELLERIFNQNEQSLGIFFLHEDADSGIAEPSVALLRVSVSLRSDHYPMLQDARVGRLSEEFRAKLGWLLGNLYARPATRDWYEREGGKGQLKKLVDKYIEEQIRGLGPRWLDDEIVEEASAQAVSLDGVGEEELQRLRPRAKHEQCLEEIRLELARVAPELDEAKITKLTNRLLNNTKFKKLFSCRSVTSDG